MVYILNQSMRNYLRPKNRWLPPVEDFLMRRRAYYRPAAPPVNHMVKAGILSFSIDFENRYIYVLLLNEMLCCSTIQRTRNHIL
jgi:hypothetical protein